MKININLIWFKKCILYTSYIFIIFYLIGSTYFFQKLKMNPNKYTELLIIEVEIRKNMWHAGDENYNDRDIGFFLYILKFFVLKYNVHLGTIKFDVF